MARNLDTPNHDALALSVEQAAMLTTLGRDVMYRLIMDGEVPSFKVGKRRLVPIAGLREWIERKTREAGN